MERRSRGSLAVPAALIIFSAIPIGTSLVRVVQIPLGTLPDDALYYLVVPVWHFLHVAAGLSFAILGPLQFGRVLAGRFGRAHRVTGWIYVVAAAIVALSGLRLVWEFPGRSTPLLDLARLLAALGLAACLALSVHAIRRRDVSRHRDWMIRGYAVGMGVATASLILFPIFIVTGEPPTGVASDVVFVAGYVVNIVFAEWVIRRRTRRASGARPALTRRAAGRAAQAAPPLP